MTFHDKSSIINLRWCPSYQVFINLLTNAVQSIEENGHITISAKQLTGERSYVIEVEDNGTGIEPDLLDRVFEPLYTTKAAGTGLGLSICKQIIEKHQGQISIKSRKEQGTTVMIVLPEQDKQKKSETRNSKQFQIFKIQNSK